MASLPFTTTPNLHFSHSKTAISHIPTQTHLSKPQLQPEKHQISCQSHFHNISSLCKQGQLLAAFNLLTEMDPKHQAVGPEIYGQLLQGCVYERALFAGRQIHARIVKNGDLFASNEFLETKLLILYAKCNLLEVTNSLFCRLWVKNEFSWAAIIGLWCRMGFNEEALMGFSEMVDSGVVVDNFVVPNVLKACGSLRWIGFGRGVHGYVVKLGMIGCVFVSSSLVDMYGKCGVLEDARKLFDNMPERNVVTWNSMIGGYVQNGFNQEAISVFSDMRLKNVEPSQVTMLSFLSASANLVAVEEGKQGHAIAVLFGLKMDNILGSSILNFYSKVGLIEDAELVFSRMLEKDAVTWNLLIATYVQFEQVEKALKMCQLMRVENLRFDSVTLACILSACANAKNIKLGKEGHCYCIRNNLESDLGVANCLINMYGKCEKVDDARQVFNSITSKDLVLWNTVLTAYAELGLIGEALRLFYQMQLEGLPPNVTSWNSVILGFIRNGQINEAIDMFSQMQAIGIHPNLITLTTLISGLVQSGLDNEAFLTFQKMEEYGIRPNIESIISTISACKDVASLLYGRAIHGYILRHDFLSSSQIATALVEMYTKCGNVDHANRVFL